MGERCWERYAKQAEPGCKVAKGACPNANLFHLLKDIPSVSVALDSGSNHVAYKGCT